MLCSVLVCCVLVGADRVEPTQSATSLTELSAYQAAKKEAGRDADAQVRLALWCESHGMLAERSKHLALAVLYDPSHALARGLLGMVAYQGKWGRPDVVARQVENDPTYRDAIREYLERRSRTADKADSHLKLASWCEQKGLKAQALTHYEQVTILDPRATPPGSISASRSRGIAGSSPTSPRPRSRTPRIKSKPTSTGSPSWKSCETTCAARISHVKRAPSASWPKSPTRAPVPMIWALFVPGPEASQLLAVATLNQIDGPAASNALAALAIFSPTAVCPAQGVGRPGPARSSRHPRAVDQLDPQAIQVSGSSHGRSGIDGRAVHRRGKIQHSARLSGNGRRSRRDASRGPITLGRGQRFRFVRPATHDPAQGGESARPGANPINDPYDYLASQIRSTALSSDDIDNGIGQLQRGAAGKPGLAAKSRPGRAND